MNKKISFEEFLKVEILSGTIVDAKNNEKAKKPAYILKIDFGERGVKMSSAQITDSYSLEDLIGKQIVAVCNFPEKIIAGIKSEVLVLGAYSKKSGVVLLEPSFKIDNGCIVG